jgi:hypothetical protein
MRLSKRHFGLLTFVIILVATSLIVPQVFSQVGEAPSSPPVLPPQPIPNAIGGQSGAPQLAPPSTSQPSTNVPAVTSGTWTPLNDQPSTHSPVFYPTGIFLLTDGTVLAQDGSLTDVAWYKLTPDDTGSYINGTWSQVASPPNCPNGYDSTATVYSPLYYASAILPDGRFVIIGGEYDYNYTYYNGSGEVWTNQGAIYDPVANSWTCINAPSGWSRIGDAQSVVHPTERS